MDGPRLLNVSWYLQNGYVGTTTTHYSIENVYFAGANPNDEGTLQSPH